MDKINSKPLLEPNVLDMLLIYGVVIYYSCNTTTKKDIILEGKEDVTNETL